MRIMNLSGRLALLTPDGTAVDVEDVSAGKYGSDPQRVYDDWAGFCAWAAEAPLGSARPFDPADLRAVTPSPRQILAIGMNYRDHAEEVGLALPDEPSVFTKFASSLTGPFGEIAIPQYGNTDWEVEIVAVIGRPARHVTDEEGWQYVAGLTVGQDISERVTQTRGPTAQFSLGKSFPGFGPVGPWLVSVDEFTNPDDLELGCSVNGTTVQHGRSSDLVFSVPQLVAKLSEVLTLLPGDIIFTGTPAGVGAGRSPQAFLKPGDELVSWVEGIGEMRHHMVEARVPSSATYGVEE